MIYKGKITTSGTCQARWRHDDQCVWHAARRTEVAMPQSAVAKEKKALEPVKQPFIELLDSLAVNSPFIKTSICHLFTLHVLFINPFLIKCN